MASDQSNLKQQTDQNKNVFKTTRKVPQVRQTLTSKYRLLKANPLLVHELEKKIADDKAEEVLFTPLKMLVKVLDSTVTEADTSRKSLIPIKKTHSVESFLKPQPREQLKPTLKESKSLKTLPVRDIKPAPRSHIQKEPMPVKDLIKNRHKVSVVNRSYNKPSTAPRSQFSAGATKQMNQTICATKTSNIGDRKPIVESKDLKTAIMNKNRLNLSMVNKSYNKPSTAPRSQSSAGATKQMNQTISAMKTSNVGDRKPFVKSKDLKTAIMNKNRLNLSMVNKIYNKPSTAPRSQSSATKQINHTNSTMKTKSTAAKAISTTKKTDAVNQTLIITNPTMNEMAMKLSEWLKSHGKSIHDFHNLQCFDANRTLTLIEEEKENIEPTLVTTDSYEDLRCTPENEKQTKQENDLNLASIAKAALLDLHNLILEGYSTEQCESWLRLIKQKCSSIENDPQYWECRAGLEQTQGNLNQAVTYYKTAIIQGAEIQTVDKNLDQLLEKFSLLNISADAYSNQDRKRILNDARNIFKSSIIQFAVREKALKQKHDQGLLVEKQLFATPVRRSTRLTRSAAFTSTPGVKIYSSLQDIDDSLRCSLNFQCNKALKE